MWTTYCIRQHFLDYFQNNRHQIVASSSLVPRNDPTLLFTAAGMVQFKDVFTGLEKKSYTRATTSQKCLRAGGKHNDLENVGYTSRHHTFFEMLGNFSFGDYFKAEAIELAWNLITKDFAIPVDRLLVTVYHEDEEAIQLWKKVAGLPDSKIIRISTSDNFWSMGETGPCGPCSEIFYDHGPSIAGGPPGTPEQDGDRFTEIWNLVFMQYEQTPEGRLDLPKPSIDTGMGLERISAVLQGVHDNYDIDLFKSLIQASEDKTGIKATGKALNSHRVIADHLRACSFLIADGVMPSNEGRGYVLRRIMRRAMRHVYLLGSKEPLMHRLVPTLIEQMGDSYGELLRAQALIEESLRLEEERFRETLGRGLKLLTEETARLSSSQTLDGSVAFKLYDTYGFPLDLTQDILRSENRQVDLAGFDLTMNKQKSDARAAWSGSGEKQNEGSWYQILEQNRISEFLGYSTTTAEGILQSILVGGVVSDQASEGQKVQLIFNQTPFYGESGGQMGDTGHLKCLDGTVVEIFNTIRKVGGLLVHEGNVIEGHLKIGQVFKLNVDDIRRSQLKANHSATHLLHAVLRRNLGSSITQKGSLVAADRLRFDFSHAKPIAADMLALIENQVNDLIRGNTAVSTRLMNADEAVKSGAMALFGEKYGDEVRVVSMGKNIDAELKSPYSHELCGGTHVGQTGDIGYFKILSETGVAAGIRRIEAVTGLEAEKYVQQVDSLVKAAIQVLKVQPDSLISRLEALQDERRKLERTVKDLKIQMLNKTDRSDEQENEIQTINGRKFLKRLLNDIAPGNLKKIAEDLKTQTGADIVALASGYEGKGSIVVAVVADMTASINAVTCVQRAAEIMGGRGGGGRPDMAQAGGPQINQLGNALQAIEDLLKI
ncbi:MAG: alanine--tRNA ligase [Janthinobacterium lividum]